MRPTNIENSLKYSQKIYSNKNSQYNNFLVTNNLRTNNLVPYTLVIIYEEKLDFK